MVDDAVSGPWVLGIAASHNGAVCLMHGHEIVAAIQEERLTRQKHAALVPAAGFRGLDYVLSAASIAPSDIDLVVLCPLQPPSTAANDLGRHPALRSRPRLIIPHHLGHATAAYACSGFSQATVLVVDGMGSRLEDLPETEREAVVGARVGREAVSIYRASGGRLVPVEKHLACHPAIDLSSDPRPRMFPFSSLGFMYQTVAEQIFGSWHDSGKLMGLAAHGAATMPVGDFFGVENGALRFEDCVPRRFRHSDRWPARRGEYSDLAASTQAALESGLQHFIERAANRGASRNLCYSGGVALNITANERLLHRTGLFANVYVQPAAEDCGTAVGAAFHGVWTLTGEHRPIALSHDFLGRTYGSGVPEVEQVAGILASGRIVGWFEGGSEFGPRALGHRSILADPRRPDMKARLDVMKGRESFRPYGPAVLEEHTAEWFELDATTRPSPFMLRAPSFRTDRSGEVPAVVHVDGTGRLQTVARGEGSLRKLIDRFWSLTGVPMLLNTSFNGCGQPMVETPAEALELFRSMELDACVVDRQVHMR
jgi:carbamoyltransferase